MPDLLRANMSDLLWERGGTRVREEVLEGSRFHESFRQ